MIIYLFLFLFFKKRSQESYLIYNQMILSEDLREVIVVNNWTMKKGLILLKL